MTTPLRYIIVGTGGFGAYWCQQVLPRLSRLGKAIPAAAVDLNPDALQNARDYLGLPPEYCYTVLDQALIQVAADFIIIVVPPVHHESVVDAAMSHNLHILSEKPLADTMPACARIYQKVTAAGVKMAVTMSHRFDQDKQSLEAVVKSGRYGQLNYIVYRFTHNLRQYGSWGAFRHQIPDPLLVEGAVHHFDILRALSGSDGATVYTNSWNPPWGEYAGDSTALVNLTMTNGVHCFYEGAKANASTLNGWNNDYIRIECENGTLELDNRRLRLMYGEGWDAPLVEDLPLLERPVWTNPWIAEMFCDWLQGGPPPPTQLRDNIQCCALLFAAIESAHSGIPIDVQAFLRRYIDDPILHPNNH